MASRVVRRRAHPGDRRPAPPPEEAGLTGQKHTPGRDSDAISYHYDQGNQLYAALLDEHMAYSCAYFRADPAHDLGAQDGSYGITEAQRDKLELICAKLGLQPGMRLLGVVWALLTGTWLIAVRIHRHAIVDVVWGAGFLLVALISLLLAGGHGVGDTGRGVLTGVWGLRLAVHIGRRNAGHGEDGRYVDIQERATGSPAWHMYRRVYLP